MSGREYVLKGLLTDSQRQQQQGGPSLGRTRHWEGGGSGAAMPLLATPSTGPVETARALSAKASGVSVGRPYDRTVRLPSQLPAGEDHSDGGAEGAGGAEYAQQRDDGAHRQYIAELSDGGRLTSVETAVRAMLGPELMHRPMAPSGRGTDTDARVGEGVGGGFSAMGPSPSSSCAGRGARRHRGTAAAGDTPAEDCDHDAALDHLQRLYHLEVRHWAGVSFSTATSAPVQVPSTLATAPRSRTGAAGVVTVARLFPQPPTRYASTLLCGMCNGRLAAYAVRWTGQLVELVTASAALAKKDQSPVVEVKAAPFGSDMVVSRTERGTIMIHHMNWALSGETATGLAPSVRKKNTSWFPFSLFSRRAAKTTVQEMPLLFRIDPADGLFVQPGLLDALQLQDPHSMVPELAAGTSGKQGDGSRAVEAGRAGKQSNPSKGGGGRFFGGASAPTLTAVEEAQLLPTDACFHPSLTALGTTTSVVVATAGGDVVKYNMDHLQPTLASPVVYPAAPFVQKEFIHPQNAPSGFAVTAGVADKPGNRVFRELFHYHRHKVLLLDPIQRLSPYMLSLDQTGRLAVWQYSPKCLEGKGWFRPHSTAKLALQTKDLVPVPSSPVDDDAQTEGRPEGEVAAPRLLTPPPDSALSQLKVREVFANAETQRVFKWYSPVHDAARQVWVQYRTVEYDAVVLPGPAQVEEPGVIVDSAGVAVPASPNRFKVPKKVLSGAAAAAAAGARATVNAQAGASAGDSIEGTPHNAATPTGSAKEGRWGKGAGAGQDGNSSLLVAKDNEALGGGSIKSDHSKPEAATGDGPAGLETEQEGGSEVGGGSAEQSGKQREGSAGSSTSSKQGEQGAGLPVVEPPTGLAKEGERVGMGWSAKSEARLFSSSSRGDLTPGSREGPPVVTVQLRVGDADGQGGGGTSEVEVVQLEADGGLGSDDRSFKAKVTTAPPDRPRSGDSARDETAERVHGSHKTLPAAMAEPAVTVASIVAVTGSVVDTTTLDSAAELGAQDQGDSPSMARHSIFGTPSSAAGTGPVAMLFPPVTPPSDKPSRGASAASSTKRAELELPPPPEFPVTVFTEWLRQLYLSSTRGAGSASAGGSSAEESSGKEAGRLTAAAGLGAPTGSQRSSPLPIPDATAADHGPSGSAHPQPMPASAGPQQKQRRVVEWAEELLAERDLRFSILKAKMTSDGTELVLLLTSNPPASAAPGQVAASLTVYYLVPYLALEGHFSKSFPRLYLPSDTDGVLDFCVGPVVTETLTRSAFVLTRHAVRVFSLHTGREIITNCVPFVWDLASFAPTMVSLCASQRVLTLTAPDDARVAVYLLQHCDDGSTDRTEQQEVSAVRLREKLLHGVRQVPCPVRLDLPVLPAREYAVRTVLNLVVPSAPQHAAAVQDMQDIVEALVDHVMRCVDLVIARDRRAGFIQELFDGNLGYIAPTTWPPPIETFPALQLSAPDMEEATLVEGDAFSPNAVSRERGRQRRHAGKRKHRKHRTSPSHEGQQAAVEDSEGDDRDHQQPQQHNDPQGKDLEGTQGVVQEKQESSAKGEDRDPGVNAVGTVEVVVLPDV